MESNKEQKKDIIDNGGLPIDEQLYGNDSWLTVVMAASFGFWEKVKKLITADPDCVNTEDSNGTVLHYAVKYRETEIIRWLIDNTSIAINLANESHGATALHLAAVMGYIEAVEIFLAHKDILTNVRSHIGRTPIWSACFFQRTEVLIKLLNDKKVDQSIYYDQDNSEPMNLLCYAAAKNLIQTLRVLLQHSTITVYDHAETGISALHCAAGNFNSTEPLECFLAIGDLDVNYYIDEFMTPICSAITTNALNNIRLILDHRSFNIKAKCTEANSMAIHYAAYHGSFEAFRMIAEHPGCDLQATDGNGDTPLGLAETSDQDRIKKREYLWQKLNLSDEQREKTSIDRLQAMLRHKQSEEAEVFFYAPSDGPLSPTAEKKRAEMTEEEFTLLIDNIKKNDPEVRYLNLSGKGLTDRHVARLVETLAENIYITNINLNSMYTPMSEEPQDKEEYDITAYLELFNNVRFYKNHEGKLTVVSAQLLTTLTRLEKLDISNNPIGDDGAKALATSKSIRFFRLNNCNITAKGVEPFLRNELFIGLTVNGPGLNLGLEEDSDSLATQLNQRQIQNQLKYEPDKAHEITQNELKKKAAFAASTGELATLRDIVPRLSGGVNDLVDADETLLYIASAQGKVHIVRYLLGLGAHIEIASREETPLQKAAEMGHVEVVKVLLEHAANISGEITFDREDAFSISAFKFNMHLVGCIHRLKDYIHLSDETADFYKEKQAYIQLWDYLFSKFVRPWDEFSLPELKIDLTLYAMDWFDELTDIITTHQLTDEFADRIQEATDYKGIWYAIYNKLKLAHEQLEIPEQDESDNLNNEDYFSDSPPSDDSDTDDSKQSPITSSSVNATVVQQDSKKRLFKEELNEQIKQLNNEIKTKGFATINWANYPLFYIAQYRGIHFFRHKFTANQRRDYRKTKHLNRANASAAAFELAEGSIKAAQLTRESNIENAIIALREWFAKAREVENCEQYWEKPNNREIFDTFRDLVQMRWSNSMKGFMEDLKNPGDHPLKLLIGALGNSEVPFFATSDLAEHALKYAYGQKPDATSKAWRLRPRFQLDGSTKRPYPGNIMIFLFTPKSLNEHDPNQVIDMYQRGLRIGPRIISERETNFSGGIDQVIGIHEETLKIPSFKTYKPYYLAKYGLTKEDFDLYKKKIIESEPGSSDEAKRAEHKKVKNEIIECLIKFHIKRLDYLVNQAAEQRGGYIIYQHLNGTYSLEPPELEEIKQRHNRAVAQRKKLNKQRESTHQEKRLTPKELTEQLREKYSSLMKASLTKKRSQNDGDSRQDVGSQLKKQAQDKPTSPATDLSKKSTATIPAPTAPKSEMSDQKLFFTTKGAGDCFIHAAFGKLVNGIYQVENPSAFRKQYADFLKKFTGLDDPAMPPSLREKLVAVFSMFFEHAGLHAIGEMEDVYVVNLRKTVAKKLDTAEETVKLLKKEITDCITNPLSLKAKNILKVLMKNIADNNEIKDQYREIRTLLLGTITDIEHITDEDLVKLMQLLPSYPDYIQDKINAELQTYVNIFNDNESFSSSINNKEIIKEFTHNKLLYNIYLEQIQKQQYYIYFEEIPIWTNLSGRPIQVWYRDGNRMNRPQFYPDDELIAWIDQNFQGKSQLLFSDHDPVAIFHDGFIRPGVRGNHYSRANAPVILNLAVEKAPAVVSPDTETDGEMPVLTSSLKPSAASGLSITTSIGHMHFKPKAKEMPQTPLSGVKRKAAEDEAVRPQ